ncbi:MAG: siderophore-interacting protein [Bosea sp.]|nr:siderophore-interacting protein [Bosea sp. (in: a-proteobacteria)]
MLISPPPEQRPAIRKYAIHEIDVAAGTLAIDFVLRDEAGPGSAFATHVQIGDRIGMAGRGGRELKQAECYLFLADETGLAALARRLEHMPAGASGLALVEIADAAERQPLSLGRLRARRLPRDPRGGAPISAAGDRCASRHQLLARRRLGGEARGGEAQGCVDQRPKRVAAKGTGSQNGICPVISSARSRPVAGPSVKP